MKSYNFTRRLADGSTITDTIQAANFTEALRLYRELLANLPA